MMSSSSPRRLVAWGFGATDAAAALLATGGSDARPSPARPSLWTSLVLCLAIEYPRPWVGGMQAKNK